MRVGFNQSITRAKKAFPVRLKRLEAAEGSRLPVALVLRAPSRPATLPAGGIHAAFSSVDAATSLRLLHYFKKNI